MDNQNFTGSAPLFMVKDLGRSLNYYCDVLGFKRPQLWGDDPDFAMPSRDGFILMLQQIEGDETVRSNFSQGANWDVYFWVKDVDSLFAEFKAKGATIEYEPVVRAYEIKEFALQDVDGHFLAFGQHWSES